MPSDLRKGRLIADLGLTRLLLLRDLKTV